MAKPTNRINDAAYIPVIFLISLSLLSASSGQECDDVEPLTSRFTTDRPRNIDNCIAQGASAQRLRHRPKARVSATVLMRVFRHNFVT